MHDPIDEFGAKILEKRKEHNQTQRELASKLEMSYRTILQAENGQSIPRFDTVVMLAKKLNLSLDSLIFPETTAPNAVAKCVYDFFNGKTEKESQQYIALCKSIEAISKSKEAN